MNMKKNLSVIVAVCAASILSAATPAKAEPKTVDRNVSNALMGVSVKATLLDKLGTDALGITATVSGNTATLTGHVAKSSSQGLAEQVALSVDGITKVENKVTENVPPGAMAATEASVKNVSLEMKVKGMLLGAIGTNALHIEVEVVDGVVSLRGKPDSPETAKEAIRKTREVKGVKQVIDLLG
jgi:osmotically-inducible protein OsmY